MTKQAKNHQRLLHIVKHCEKIHTAATFFNNDYEPKLQKYCRALLENNPRPRFSGQSRNE